MKVRKSVMVAAVALLCAAGAVQPASAVDNASVRGLMPAAVYQCVSYAPKSLTNWGSTNAPINRIKTTDCWLDSNTTSYSSAVAVLQNYGLKKGMGYSVDADGYYGSGTKTAVKKAQQALGLTQDGVYGNKTGASMIWYSSKGRAVWN